jgi:hypothetical protein
VTKAQAREYRERVALMPRDEAYKLYAFLADNGFPEDRDEKLAIVEAVLDSR